ncbi:MAG: hypothetical protein IT427_20150, partial [Pirellulales bacterium]|nr:hypothetical protein [Pirellulales bacterium]
MYDFARAGREQIRIRENSCTTPHLVNLPHDTYDALDRHIGRQFDDAAALTLSDLINRYLWGPAVDQLLAEENVAWYYAPGTVDWALSDHQHTVRDWVRSSGGSTTLADHAQYDAFGNRLDAP